MSSAPTLKEVILPQHKKNDGSYPVKIRLTHNRGVKYLPTTEIARTGDYDKDLKITSRAMMRRLIDVMDDIEIIINKKNIFQLASMSVHELADFIAKEMADKDGFKLEFFQFAKEIIAKKKKHSGKNYACALSSFARFLNAESLDISLITSSLMRKYEAYLVDNYGKNARAVSMYTSHIAAIHAEARKLYNDNEMGELKIRNPFEYYTPPKQVPAKKFALDIETIQKIINISKTLTGPHKFATDMFLISFALMGTNTPDLYFAEFIDEDVIRYYREKTHERRHDNAEMQIRIEPMVKPLFNEYKSTIGNNMLNLQEHFMTYEAVGRKCNIYLKDVAKMLKIKPFSMKAARHSWPTIAYEIGIAMDIINDSLCHVDCNLIVTNIYIRKNWERRWDANNKVLSLFNW